MDGVNHSTSAGKWYKSQPMGGLGTVPLLQMRSFSRNKPIDAFALILPQVCTFHYQSLAARAVALHPNMAGTARVEGTSTEHTIAETWSASPVNPQQVAAADTWCDNCKRPRFLVSFSCTFCMQVAKVVDEMVHQEQQGLCFALSCVLPFKLDPEPHHPRLFLAGIDYVLFKISASQYFFLPVERGSDWRKNLH